MLVMINIFVQATIYSYEGKSSCFFGNGNAEDAATINFENTMYTVPAWSVTILPDCFTEVYNTAKVNDSATLMVAFISINLYSFCFNYYFVQRFAG